MSEEPDILNSHEQLTSLIKQMGPDDQDAAVIEYLKKIKYPPITDFQKDLEWFNVSEPLSFANQLKGKVVLLDFFTYCCINCMHILPILKDIETEFSVEDGFVVIGVHSAKFENEKLSKNIIAAVQRYDISHPVVNDFQNAMWKNCNVCCWPTLLLIGPNANPIVMLMGEDHKEDLHLYIRNTLEFYKSKQLISNHSIPFKSAYRLLPDLKGPLLFPGKITCYVDPSSKLEILAVSDTGNNRILILQSDGTVIHQIGGNYKGFKDGSLEEAQFNSPQGLVFQNERTLFVADTENHAIRKVDLNLKLVTTVVGTGEQGNDYKGGAEGINQEISSPWDVCIYKVNGLRSVDTQEILLIAMAGLHQIWALFLNNITWWKNHHYFSGTCSAIAGSGREENKNNHYPLAAGFAQPSGLALCEKNKALYIADSESSSIRKLCLLDGKVSAVVGGDLNPQNLFAFGDKDGKHYDAKLQHVLGLAMSNTGDVVFVADTYNHKIKKIDTSTNSISTSDVSGINNLSNFNEPAGLCLGSNDKKLYLADTNNHAIKILHLDNYFSIVNIEILDIKFPPEPAHMSLNKSALDTFSSKPVHANVKGGKLILKINLDLADGIKLTSEAPQRWIVHLPNRSWSCVPTCGTNVLNIEVVISVPHTDLKNVDVDFVYNITICKGDVCIPKKFIIRLPVHFSNDASITINNSINFTLDQSKILFQHKY